MTGADGALEFVGHALQVGNARLDVAQMLACELVDFATRQFRVLRQAKQAADLFETEAQVATPLPLGLKIMKHSHDHSELVERLRNVPAGRVDSEMREEVIELLSRCWDSIAGSSDTSMANRKVSSSRVENLTWEPPHLSFEIERHGGRVQGSKSAEMQSWSIDLENNKAICSLAGFRRLEPFSPRLDTKVLATQVHDLILQGAIDDRLTWKGRACVKVNVSVIIPDGPAKQTTQGRRKRFRSDLEHLMLAAGWHAKSVGKHLVFETGSTGVL